MQPRRSLRLVAGALVLASPLLGSCGFDKATNAPYVPAEGTINRDGDVKILSAVVVAAQPDSGTFIATLSNNVDDGADADTFEGLAGSGEWSDLQIGEFEAPEIAPRGFVNLADEGGVPVSGDFEAGDFMELTLSFGSGQTTTMDVPVVYACEEYAGLDTSAGAASAAPTEESTEETTEEQPTEEPTEETTDGATPSPSETEVGEEPTGETYDCTVASEGE